MDPNSHFVHKLVVVIPISPEEPSLAGVVLDHGHHRMPHSFVEIAEPCIAVNFENLAQLLHYDVAEKNKQSGLEAFVTFGFHSERLTCNSRAGKRNYY